MAPPRLVQRPVPGFPHSAKNPVGRKDATALSPWRLHLSRGSSDFMISTIFRQDIDTVSTSCFSKKWMPSKSPARHRGNPGPETSLMDEPRRTAPQPVPARHAVVYAPAGAPGRCREITGGKRAGRSERGWMHSAPGHPKVSGAEPGSLFTANYRPVLVACAVSQNLVELGTVRPTSCARSLFLRSPRSVAGTPLPLARDSRPGFAISRRATRGAVIGLDLRSVGAASLSTP